MMASLREKLAAIQQEREQQAATPVAGASLRDKLAAIQAQRAQPQSQAQGPAIQPSLDAQFGPAASVGPGTFERTPGLQVPQEPLPEGHRDLFDPKETVGEQLVRSTQLQASVPGIEGAPARTLDFLAGQPEGRRLSLETAGAVGGGLLGGPAGAILGTFGTALAAQGVDPVEHPFRNARNMGAIEGVAGGVAGLAAKGFNRLRQGAKGTNLVTGGREAIEQMEKSGLAIPPGQPSKNTGIDILQKVSEEAIFGGGTIRKARLAVEEQAQRDMDEFVAVFVKNSGRESVGELGEAAATNSRQIWKDRVSAAYVHVDEIAGTRVQTDAILERAKDVLRKAKLGVKNKEAVSFIDEIIGRLGKPASKRGTGVLDDAGNEIIEDIPADMSMSFEEAGSILSDLLSVTRSATDPVANARQVVAKRLAPVFDEAMEAAAANLPNAEAKALWRTARKLQREGAEVHNTKVMRSLARQEPETFFQSSVRAMRPGTIRNVRSAINDPVVWRQLQGQWMLDLLAASKRVGSEIPQGGTVISKIDKFGEEALKELVPDVAERETFKRLAKTLEITQAEVGKKIPGGVFIQLQQASAILGSWQLVIGDLDPSEASGVGLILLGPMVAARLLVNPKFARWATLGSKAKPGSTQAASALAGMAALVGVETRRFEARQEAQRKREASAGRFNASNTAIP